MCEWVGGRVGMGVVGVDCVDVHTHVQVDDGEGVA